MNYTRILIAALALALAACSENPAPAPTDAANRYSGTPADTATVTDPAPVPTPSHTTEQEAKEQSKKTGTPVPPASDTVRTPKKLEDKIPPTATPPINPGIDRNKSGSGQRSGGGGGLPMPVSDTGAEADVVAPPSHAPWSTLLAKHVRADGRVDYRGFQADRAALQAYLDALAAAPPEAAWSRNEKMAYWINAYNAFTIKLITDNYPVTSITKLDGGKPWDVKRITLGGRKYSLNAIENEILRPQFKDARIHFALNCAARSCPPLANEAFTAARLERQLDERTRRFINDRNFNTLQPGKARLSKLFDWYKADFGSDVRVFVNRYADKKVEGNAVVEFGEYDWGLNE